MVLLLLLLTIIYTISFLGLFIRFYTDPYRGYHYVIKQRSSNTKIYWEPIPIWQIVLQTLFAPIYLVYIAIRY